MRNEDSFDRKESIFLELRSAEYFHRKMIKGKIILIIMKVKKIYPSVEAANECTDTTGPPLLMNMPN